MPLDLQVLAMRRAATTVDYAGDSIIIEYQPDLITGEWMAGVIDAEREADIHGLAGKLHEVIRSWDLTADGEPYPVSAENIAKLPWAIVLRIEQQIVTEVRGDPNSRTSSRKALQRGSFQAD